MTQSLYQILDNYLRYHRIEGSTESTPAHKKKELGAFLKWLESEGHSLVVEHVSIEDIEGHLAWMQDRGLSINSLHTRLRQQPTHPAEVYQRLVQLDGEAQAHPGESCQRDQAASSAQDTQSFCQRRTVQRIGAGAALWLSKVLVTTRILVGLLKQRDLGDVNWDFIVTNLSYPPQGIFRFYNGHGVAGQRIEEDKYALNWTRLSCHKFVANQVRLGRFIQAD